jgi:DNA-binding XRE family transcriptional regulator
LFVNQFIVCIGNQIFGNEAFMDEQARIIGANVARLRHAAGLSQAQLAGALGVRQNTIAAIELGKTKKSKYLSEIARALKVRLVDVDPQFEAEESVVVPGPALVGDRDLQVFGSVEGGDGAIVVSSDPIGIIKRPSPLAGVVGGYGVLVVGESMTPLVRPGDTVLINPHLPPRKEDLCLFIYDQDGDFRATIKEFVSQTKDAWSVKRYSPTVRRIVLKKREWPRCHVVVGKYNRR